MQEKALCGIILLKVHWSVYLTILVRAAARLSVFLNKARIRLFISLQENSTARGPFPSAHLKKINQL